MTLIIRRSPCLPWTWQSRLTSPCPTRDARRASGCVCVFFFCDAPYDPAARTTEPVSKQVANPDASVNVEKGALHIVVACARNQSCTHQCGCKYAVMLFAKRENQCLSIVSTDAEGHLLSWKSHPPLLVVKDERVFHTGTWHPVEQNHGDDVAVSEETCRVIQMRT